MRIGVTGIVSDQFGSVLAIKRDDSRTWSPPGGTLDVGELPSDAVVREVEEESGVKVLPIRLVGIEYVQYSGTPYLNFVFRCLKRGGELRTSAESLEVGMIPRAELDKVRMASFHRARTIDGLNHATETPQWIQRELSLSEQRSMRFLHAVVYPYKNIKRKLLTGQSYTPPVRWEVMVSAVITNKAGQTLWKDGGGLPHCVIDPNGADTVDQTPWEAIEHMIHGVQLVDVVAVYVDRERPRIHLVWIGNLEQAVDGYVWRDVSSDQVELDALYRAAVDPMRGETLFAYFDGV